MGGSAVAAAASDDDAATVPEAEAVVRDAVPTLMNSHDSAYLCGEVDALGTGIQPACQTVHDVTSELASVSSMNSFPESSLTPNAFDAARRGRFWDGEASSIIVSSDAPLDHSRFGVGDLSRTSSAPTLSDASLLDVFAVCRGLESASHAGK